MTKADTTSPTMSLEAIMLSCVTDAKEGQYVVVTDIPGACRNGARCVHAPGRDFCRTVYKTGAKSIQKICGKAKKGP